MIGYSDKKQHKGENELIGLKVPKRLQSITVCDVAEDSLTGRRVITFHLLTGSRRRTGSRARL